MSCRVRSKLTFAHKIVSGTYVSSPRTVVATWNF